MTLTSTIVTLAAHPEGDPRLSDFKIIDKPVRDLEDGEVLLKIQYISLDPYQRGRMAGGKSYAQTLSVGDPIMAATVSEVVESKYGGIAKGDKVLNVQSIWASYDIAKGSILKKIDPRIPNPSWALGVFGMPGVAAYHGLVKVGRPKAGETLVVSSAAGPVGSTVGQLAKARGLRVIGIAGGPDKCKHVVQDLGFDACVDYKSPEFASELAKAAPNGVDVYFENVGGAVMRAVFPLMNDYSRITLCGLVSGYNDNWKSSADHDELPMFLVNALVKSMTIQGFLTRDFLNEFDELYDEVLPLVKDGKFKYYEDVTNGLENAPQAFLNLFNGKNKAKAVVIP